MTSRWLPVALAAALGSAGLLVAALGFQYLADLPPCPMCIWQRWPHLAAVGIGLVLLVLPAAGLALAGAFAAAVSGGIGVFHAGVERGWWEGPTTCTAGSVSGVSPAELLDQILAAPVIRCDEALWEFLGLSMAGWNAVLSFALAAVWVSAWRIARDQASSSASQ